MDTADPTDSELVAAYQAGMITKDQVLRGSQQMTDKLDSMGSSIVEQQAFGWTKRASSLGIPSSINCS